MITEIAQIDVKPGTEKDFEAAWRALVGPYFASPLEVEHTETVLTSD